MQQNRKRMQESDSFLETGLRANATRAERSFASELD
jgi:hypothetical protein